MNDFPNLPKSWQVKTLGEVCEINPKNKLDDNLEVSFIPMNLILDKFQNKFSYETKIWKNIKKGYTHLQNNCIALAKITPCFENGKCVILDDLKNGYGAGTTEIIILLPNTQKVFIKYIFYFLNTQNFIEQGKRNFKGTAGQLRISTDFVSNCKIPIPPLEIQRRIAKRLDEAFSRIQSGTKHLKSAKDNLIKYKQSMLKSAFNGTLTQDCPPIARRIYATIAERIHKHPPPSPLRKGGGTRGLPRAKKSPPLRRGLGGG